MNAVVKLIILTQEIEEQYNKYISKIKEYEEVINDLRTQYENEARALVADARNQISTRINNCRQHILDKIDYYKNKIIELEKTAKKWYEDQIENVRNYVEGKIKEAEEDAMNKSKQEQEILS